MNCVYFISSIITLKEEERNQNKFYLCVHVIRRFIRLEQVGKGLNKVASTV